MKSRKAISLLLAMAVTAAAGCNNTRQTTADSGADVAENGRPTITFMSIDIYGRTLGSVGSEDILKAAAEYTGINVKFNWVANDSYGDIIGVTLMDKDNMPMVITYGSDLQPNIVQAAKDGAFWDLNEFVWDEEKYPNLSQMNKDVCRAFTVDGSLIGVYRYRPVGRMGLGYRADWAEKLGLGEPETIEDVYNMMYQFTYGDPDGNGKDDTYGLCMCKYSGPLDIIQVWFGAGNQWKEENGKLTPSHQTEEYMEALRWSKKMYDEGLIYRDWATRETNTWTDGVKNGECGMFLDVLDNSRRVWDYFESEQIPAVTGDGLAAMKLVGGIAKEAGGERRTQATTGAAGCFLITKSGAKTVADVENCLTYLDKMCDEEMRILADYGLEGRDYEINEEGYIVDLLAHMEIQEKPQIGLNQSVPFVPELPDMKTVEKSDRLIREEEVKYANEKIAVFNPATGYLVSSLVNADIGSDLKDILDRARTQYICGQIDDDGLKEQFRVWEQRGGLRLIEEINEMYQADLNSR